MNIRSPAKINLFLEITGKREDGYHDIFTLMCRISLYDIVSLAFRAGKISVICDSQEVPEDETNLAHRAADLFFHALNKYHGKKGEGIEITIKKNIPVAAGLGGGSSNAAAVLSGLNKFYGNPFTLDKIMKMGSTIGADIPFFIFQKPAIASGIGDKLVEYNDIAFFHILLICPGFSLSTAKVYKNLNLGLTKCEKKLKSVKLKKECFDENRHLCNDLESVAVLWRPEILEVKEALLSQGASGALMSGSGPAVFGLFSDSDKAYRAKHALSKKNGWRLFLVDMLV